MSLDNSIRVWCKTPSVVTEGPDFGWASKARKTQSNKWAEFKKTQHLSKQIIHKNSHSQKYKKNISYNSTGNQNALENQNQNLSNLDFAFEDYDIQLNERNIQQNKENQQTNINQTEIYVEEDGIKNRLERLIIQQIHSNNSTKKSSKLRGIKNYISNVIGTCLNPEEIIAACELIWPKWAENSFYLLQQSTGQELNNVTSPQEAAFVLLSIAKLLKRKYHSFSPSLARTGCVRGLVEALRVSQPRLVWDGNNYNLMSFVDEGQEVEGEDEDDFRLEFNDRQFQAVKPLFGPVETPSRWAMESLGWQWTSAAVWAIGSLAGPLFYDKEMESLMLGLKHINGTASSHQANRMLVGLSKARHYGSWLPQLAQQSILQFQDQQFYQGNRKDLVQDFVGNITALAQLGYCPRKLPDILQREIDMKQFSKDQLVLLVWSLAVLEQLETYTFKNAWREICQRGMLGMQLKKWQLCQLYQTALGIQLEAKTFQADSVGWNDGAAELLQKAEKVWEEEGKDLEKKRESSYQRSIGNTLSSMGLFHVKEDVTSGYAIDLTLPEYKIAIEAEGPHHMSRTDLRLLGPTLYKHRLLRGLGWRLVSVAYHEWDALFDMQEQREYLGQKMNEVMDEGERRNW